MAQTSEATRMTHAGSCHCGKVTFEVDGELDQVLECNCSHCRRKGYLLWFVPREHVRIEAPLSELSTYRFNRHVIDHHFCPNCGCAPFGMGTTADGKATVAVNVRCIEQIDLTKLGRIAVDGRSY